MGKFIRFTGIFLVAATAMLALLGATAPREDTVPPGFSGRHLEVDGLRQRISESGSGAPTILLVHGALGSIEDWETVTLLLAQHARGHRR